MTAILQLRRPSLVDTGEQKVYSTFAELIDDNENIIIRYRINDSFHSDRWGKLDVIKIEIII